MKPSVHFYAYWEQKLSASTVKNNPKQLSGWAENEYDKNNKKIFETSTRNKKTLIMSRSNFQKLVTYSKYYEQQVLWTTSLLWTTKGILYQKTIIDPQKWKS